MSRVRLSALLLLGGAFCAASAPAAQRAQAAPPLVEPVDGQWEPPFQHDLTGFPALLPNFNAVHMALIPKGQHRGKLIVWDVISDTREPEWKQRWSIVDVRGPGPVVCLNDELSLPAGQGDLFCAGLAWSADGNLFVAGGTSQYPTLARHPGSEEGGYIGGRLAYFWDPFVGSIGWWVRQADLEVNRWYPTVLKTASGSLLVAGGTADTGLDFFSDNDFEAFIPAGPTSGTWMLNGADQRFQGPPGFGPFSIYPRLFHLSTGEQFLAGMSGVGTKMRASVAPGVWNATATSEWDYRSYGTAVLLPLRPDAAGSYRDQVMIIGGNATDVHRARDPEDGDYKVISGGPVALVETCFPGSADPADWDWIPARPLHHARATANAVLLADGSVLVLGGRRGTAANETPTNVPELYDGTRWIEMPPHVSPRSYHSTAVLLPSGKVLSAGGDTATWDYEVFVPPYLRTGRPRPVVTSSPPTMGYESVAPANYTIRFQPRSGANAVVHAALVAPGAVTHHTDVNQRYVELVTLSVGSDEIVVQAPRDSDLVPPGYYMLFLVSASGVPSEAVWVKVS